MSSSAEARMGVRVALAGLWAGSGGTVDFRALRLRLPEESYCTGASLLLQEEGAWGQVERAKPDRELGKEEGSGW